VSLDGDFTTIRNKKDPSLDQYRVSIPEERPPRDQYVEKGKINHERKHFEHCGDGIDTVDHPDITHTVHLQRLGFMMIGLKPPQAAFLIHSCWSSCNSFALQACWGR